MKQGVGALLMLIGAVMFHIASQNEPIGSVTDLWKSLTDTITGVTS